MAIKMCQSMSQEADEFIREAQLMTSLRPSPNVVQILGVSNEPEHYAIILEYLSGGSLWDHLKKQKEPLPIPRVIKLIDGISTGMFHLVRIERSSIN